MKVKELIAELQKVNPELEVYGGTGDEYYHQLMTDTVNVEHLMIPSKEDPMSLEKVEVLSMQFIGELGTYDFSRVQEEPLDPQVEEQMWDE